MNELLRSIAILALLGGGLALLLVIADYYFSNYGECTIRINRQRELKVKGGMSLLSTLLTQKIFIPSACGGRGTCAYCKVKVLEGGGSMLPLEEPYMTPEERASSVRLSCQVKVRNDIAIEIPESLFAIREYRATVDRITDLTYDIKEVRFKLIDPPTITFKAGQYIQLRTPEYEGNKEMVYRAYSMSSTPADNGAVETIIRLVPNGICTTWVFRHMKVGDEIFLNGPYGDFRLRPSDAEVIMIAGGSGFSPMKAMILDAPEEMNRRGARFFFGARAIKDLFHLDLMREVQAKYPNIRFIPALSQPDPGDVWEGDRGLITDVLARHVPDASGKEFYLCGSPGMIDACLKVLRGKGASDNAIFYDKFS